MQGKKGIMMKPPPMPTNEPKAPAKVPSVNYAVRNFLEFARITLV
jgi:hypothetical protein